MRVAEEVGVNVATDKGGTGDGDGAIDDDGSVATSCGGGEVTEILPLTPLGPIVGRVPNALTSGLSTVGLVSEDEVGSGSAVRSRSPIDPKYSEDPKHSKMSRINGP